MWNNLQGDDKLNTPFRTLKNKRVCPVLFPNVVKIINILLLTSVTASGVERANSSLRFVRFIQVYYGRRQIQCSDFALCPSRHSTGYRLICMH